MYSSQKTKLRTTLIKAKKESLTNHNKPWKRFIADFKRLLSYTSIYDSFWFVKYFIRFFATLALEQERKEKYYEKDEF